MNEAFTCAVIETSDDYTDIDRKQLGMILSFLQEKDDIRMALIRHRYNNEQDLDINNSDNDSKLLYSTIKEIYSELSIKSGLYLSPGVLPEFDGDKVYKTGYLYNPEGKIILKQRQLFLNKQSRDSGFNRGVQLSIVNTDFGRIGFMLNEDCYYPEVGRFLSLKGIDIVLAVNLIEQRNFYTQLSGVWSQVQQNQFYSLENVNRGLNMIYGPCEISPYRSGIIGPIGDRDYALNYSPERYISQLRKIQTYIAGYSIIIGKINLNKLNKIQKKYPIKKQLNTELYKKELG